MFSFLKWTMETPENVWNLFKANNKYTRTTSVTLLRCLQTSYIVLVFPLLTLNKRMPAGCLKLVCFHKHWWPAASQNKTTPPQVLHRKTVLRNVKSKSLEYMPNSTHVHPCCIKKITALTYLKLVELYS